MLSLLLAIPLLLVGIGAEEEFQDTFYVPYSETEDVDFHVAKEGRGGCYQWSADNDEVIELVPVYTDYAKQCGYRLEFKILPGTASKDGNTVVKITGENIDETKQDFPVLAKIEFTIIIAPVAKLEVMGLKTKMVAGQNAVPFGVAAYDAEGNEFDTLDGVQLSWYVGAHKDIAKFEDRHTGPIVKMKPLKSGKGGVICLLSDPNYEKLDPAVLEFTITAPLIMEPDGVYLLEGGNAKISLLESIGSKEKPEFSALKITGPDAEYLLDVKEKEIVSINKETGIITGVMPGEETILLVKDLDHNIVKGTPVRCTRPDRLEVLSMPHPESRQLVVGREYEIVVNVYDKENHKIYPSENILTKTTFGKQFEIIEISENGLWARVRTTLLGVGKIKASLRSTLTPDDDEIELTPHVKGFTDFQIFEELLVTPAVNILPWDETINPEYKLEYKTTGGGKVYGYRTSPSSSATVDSEGTMTVVSGPGTITLTAGMVKSIHNNATAKLYLLRPIDMDFKENIAAEMVEGNTIRIPIRAFGEMPETKERQAFSDCGDIPLDIHLSNNKDFLIEGTTKRGEHNDQGSCKTILVKGLTAGSSTKMTVMYPVPGTTRQLRIFTQISTYEMLKSISPALERESKTPIVLAVGSSRKMVLRGGPNPWIGKPSSFYKQGVVENPEIAKVGELKNLEEGNYHVYEVTCIKLGDTKVTVTVGNKPSTTNRRPGVDTRTVYISCSEPAKIQLRLGPTPHLGGSTGISVANPHNGRVMTYNYRDLSVLVTVKDSLGRTMDNVTSLQFDFQVSDEELLPITDQGKVKQGQVHVEGLEEVNVPSKAFHNFSPSGRKGDVDVYVAITGYRKDVLEALGVVAPPDLPKPPPFDDDEDYEDEEEFVEHAHGLAETLELTLTTDAEIEAVSDKIKSKP